MNEHLCNYNHHFKSRNKNLIFKYYHPPMSLFKLNRALEKKRVIKITLTYHETIWKRDLQPSLDLSLPCKYTNCMEIKNPINCAFLSQTKMASLIVLWKPKWMRKRKTTMLERALTRDWTLKSTRLRRVVVAKGTGKGRDS